MIYNKIIKAKENLNVSNFSMFNGESSYQELERKENKQFLEGYFS